MIAQIDGARHDERMTSTAGTRDAAGWGLAASLVVASAVAAAIVSATATPRADGPWLLSGSPMWIVLVPVAVAVTVVIAVWNRFRGDRRLARWVLAGAAAATAYSVAGAASGWLFLQGATASALFALAVAVATSGWTAVLALLQATALVAAESALGRRYGRRALTVILAAGIAVSSVGLLLPGRLALDAFPGMPTILPPEAAGSDAADVTSGIIASAWMASLFVAPIVLWTGAVRAGGVRRHVLIRVASGALLPALVVMVCGVWAAIVAAGGDAASEVNGLATGFAAALPVTAWWLSATVRDATGAGPRAVTSVANVVRILLWALYALTVAQTSGPAAAAFGGTAAHGALAATVLLAATFWPWSLLVRWCTRKVDARAAVAAAAALRGDERPAGERAQDALRAAMADPGVRVLLRRPGRWIDVHGDAVDAPAQSEHNYIHDVKGMSNGLFCS